jgi:hypothetical protein
MPSKACVCKRKREYCKIHGGGSLCAKHQIRRDRCRECGGTAFCKPHSRRDCGICFPLRGLVCRVRHAVRRILKKGGTQKNCCSERYLGCSYSEFLRHMQVKVDVWNTISGDNLTLSEMNIDHIKPLTLATTESICELAHFSNLQPLPSKVNILKKAVWSQTDEIFWQKYIHKNTEWRGIYLPENIPGLSLSWCV